MLTKIQIEALETLKRRMENTHAEYGRIFQDPSDPLPTNEKEVTEFIERRTRLYRDAWMLPIIDALIEGRTDDLRWLVK